jgi:hypothetical protein
MYRRHELRMVITVGSKVFCVGWEDHSYVLRENGVAIDYFTFWQGALQRMYNLATDEFGGDEPELAEPTSMFDERVIH